MSARTLGVVGHHSDVQLVAAGLYRATVCLQKHLSNIQDASLTVECRVESGLEYWQPLLPY